MPNLFKIFPRNGKFYIRIYLGREQQLKSGKKEVWRSLNTGYYSKAKINAEKVIQNFYLEFMPRKLRLSDYEFIMNRTIHTQLDRDNRERRRRNQGEKLDSEYRKQNNLHKLEEWQKAYADGDILTARALLDKPFNILNIHPDENSPYLDGLCHKLCLAMIKVYEIAVDKDNGVVNSKYENIEEELSRISHLATDDTDLMHKIKSSDYTSESNAKIINNVALQDLQQEVTFPSVSLGDLIKNYTQVEEHRKHSSDLKQKHQYYHEVILGLLGKDVELAQINQAFFREKFFKKLKYLPKSAKLRSHDKSKSIAQIVADQEFDNQDYEATEKKKPLHLAASTFNDYIEHAEKLFKFANLEWSLNLPQDLKNFRLTENTSRENIKTNFTKQHVDLIIQSESFLKAKNDISLAHKYWWFLLGLVTGMRIGEIALLTIADIRNKEGIDYISINEDNEFKKVKSKAGASEDEKNSIRDVPICDTLKKLGFMEYVANITERYNKGEFVKQNMSFQAGKTKFPSGKVKNSENILIMDTLFPNFKHTKAVNNKVYNSYTKVFSRALEELGIKEDGLKNHSFHSTRHTYRQAVRETSFKDIHESGTVICLIAAGWSTGSKHAHEGYGSGDIPLGTVLKCLNHIDTSKLYDLSSLYQQD